MELEEMKSVWMDMSQEINKQKRLTNDIIIKMAHEKSSSRLTRIIYAEGFGSIVSLAAFIYVLGNFYKFKDWLSITGGVGLSIIMLLSTILGINIVMKAKRIDVLKSSYTQVMKHFGDLQQVLKLYKWLSIGIYCIIPFLLLPVMSVLVFDMVLLENLDEFKEALIACFIIMPIIWYVIFLMYRSNMISIKRALRDTEKINK